MTRQGQHKFTSVMRVEVKKMEVKTEVADGIGAEAYG